MSLVDKFGRQITDLRISVTDRCNFRCVYCMPLEGLDWLPKEDILSFEEITEVVRQLAPLGLRRIRLTGGEPTIRPDLTSLVRMLKSIRKGVRFSSYWPASTAAIAGTNLPSSSSPNG